LLFYRAALPLSRQTLTYVAGIIRRHRTAIGSCWRRLNPGGRALLVLAYLRKGDPFAELGAGFGVCTATAWRYVNETVGLLAARAPKLRRALRDAADAGYAYVVLDAARIWGILQALATSGLITLSDKGYHGAGEPARTPYRGKNKPESQKDANRAHARLRSPGERANAQLKTWRILRKLRCCPWRAGQLAKAIHVLQIREAKSG
jgi:hypothetical protein